MAIEVEASRPAEVEVFIIFAMQVTGFEKNCERAILGQPTFELFEGRVGDDGRTAIPLTEITRALSIAHGSSRTVSSASSVNSSLFSALFKTLLAS